jgi:membrane-bound metal-dependent hydrolase YbcI (DUF457 family)
MGFLLFFLLIGAFVLYPSVRKVIFKGIWATIVGAIVTIILIAVIVVSLAEHNQ